MGIFDEIKNKRPSEIPGFEYDKFKEAKENSRQMGEKIINQITTEKPTEIIVGCLMVMDTVIETATSKEGRNAIREAVIEQIKETIE